MGPSGLGVVAVARLVRGCGFGERMNGVVGTEGFTYSFQRLSFRYLFDISDEDSAKGGTHEAVDEKVDTGVESDEKV